MSLLSNYLALTDASAANQNQCDCVCPKQIAEQTPSHSVAEACPPHTTSTNTRPNTKSSYPFPESVSRFAAGVAYTSAKNFTTLIDVGLPEDPPQSQGDKGVLILYNSPAAMPDRAQLGQKDLGATLISPQEATENCVQMNVMFTYHGNPKHHKQCIALVPQTEHFRLQTWMRDKPSDALRLVPYGYNPTKATAPFLPPDRERNTKPAWAVIHKYLNTLDDTLQTLSPVVQNIAINNTIVVMVCNFGHSELLLNFACNARSKGLEISNVLVFATDQETYDLVHAMGLMSVHFDPAIYGGMPQKAAAGYGDAAFAKMMLSKVLCVHTASLLGVDFLFQDVDVMWYKNPMTYFQEQLKDPVTSFDVYAQDDGAKSPRFAPYSANSGFYFFRNNEKTRYFIQSFLMQSDMILRSRSHQAPMNSILAEHSSLFGLTVKVLDGYDFPSGHIYHRKKKNQQYGSYFRDMVDGKRDHPYVLHMSWTDNKDNKILFYRQLDQWYLQDQCVETKLNDIPELQEGKFVEMCCSHESLFSCHYSDKASTRPCKDSPMLAKNGGEPFWE